MQVICKEDHRQESTWWLKHGKLFAMKECHHILRECLDTKSKDHSIRIYCMACMISCLDSRERYESIHLGQHITKRDIMTRYIRATCHRRPRTSSPCLITRSLSATDSLELDGEAFK
jgi:hypothetical protein